MRINNAAFLFTPGFNGAKTNITSCYRWIHPVSTINMDLLMIPFESVRENPTLLARLIGQ